MVKYANDEGYLNSNCGLQMKPGLPNFFCVILYRNGIVSHRHRFGTRYEFNTVPYYTMPSPTQCVFLIQRNLFPHIHHSIEAFQTTMVRSKCTRSKTVTITQSTTDSSLHNRVASRQPPLFVVEAATQHPSTVVAAMTPADVRHVWGLSQRRITYATRDLNIIS
ncbi:Leucine-rich repeat protein kinase family protein [Prunus dulcis]|uniref:Leucine-rich repeat protein kinase family protein n=1 Tax=Prunus dulcis TaxID=3755 RepID=A0A4Y1RYJ4_PRUDU|nr:Leucine-rich repeat protein kinase family protein [Prunus dulcis]